MAQIASRSSGEGHPPRDLLVVPEAVFWLRSSGAARVSRVNYCIAANRVGCVIGGVCLGKGFSS